MGKSFVMSAQAAARPGVESVQNRWQETEVEGVVQDAKGNFLILDAALQFESDVAETIRQARKNGKTVFFNDLQMFDAGIDGVYKTSKGDLLIEDTSLYQQADVAELMKEAIRNKRRILREAPKPKGKEAATSKAKAVQAAAAPVNPAPVAAQAAPVQAAAATSAPAEEAVAQAPAQDAPEVDEPPAKPAAPVAPEATVDSASAVETASEAAPAQEVPKAKKAFRSYWTVILGLWVAMVVIFAISWPIAFILAWVVAVVGFWFVGWNVYRFAPNWSPFIAIGWLIVTPWLALPTTSFIAKFMLPYYSAQAVVPATWFGTATLVWLGFVFKSLIGKGIGGAWKRRKNVVPFVKAAWAEPKLLWVKVTQFWAAIKAEWKKKYPN